MGKRKKKSSAADNLIDSLMDDLKDIHSEFSHHSNPAHILEDSVAIPPDAPEELLDIPNLELQDIPYEGPSADHGYQSPEDLFLPAEENNYSDYSPGEGTKSTTSEDKTIAISQDVSAQSIFTNNSDNEKTLAVEGFANAQVKKRNVPDVDVKVSVGHFRGNKSSGPSMTSIDASLVQAENLRLAQQRILELEKEVEHLRSENEELASAGQIFHTRMEEMALKVTQLERERVEDQESARAEMLLLKSSLQHKETEVAKARVKVEDLETRLKSDFKKIRVRERELENRLELLRAEKAALVRSKDEYILEQKRKIDQFSQELDNYKKKCLELNKIIEANQDQVRRTERALRLALTNLEAKEENLVPLKKAE